MIFGSGFIDVFVAHILADITSGYTNILWENSAGVSFYLNDFLSLHGVT